jgi:hypothetical protein
MTTTHPNLQSLLSAQLFALINPVAGSGDPASIHATLTQICTEASQDCVIRETKADEDITRQ